MTNEEQLIQFSGKPARTCPVSRLRLGPIADKFFITGAVAAIAGIGWMGVHLWLALNGQLPMKPIYAEIRRIHVLVQIYLFLGIFVLGFIAQAGPRLVGSKLSPSPITLLWIPALVAGVLCWHVMPASTLGRWMICAVFFSSLLYAASFQRTGEAPLRKTSGRLILLGLAVFTVSPFFAIEQAAGALFFIWAGLVTLIAGTGQQFISAFLGGRRCTEKEAAVLLMFFLLTSICIALGALFQLEFLYRAAGLGAVVSLAYYVFSTELYRAWRTALHDALALSFLLSYGWAIVGGMVLLFRASAALDITFHVWAIGWATPLIFTVSGQIMGYMSGRNATRTPFFVGAILCWQVVPIGRCLVSILQLPASFAWLVSVSATAVLLFWCWELIAAERVILARVVRAPDSRQTVNEVPEKSDA